MPAPTLCPAFAPAPLCPFTVEYHAGPSGRLDEYRLRHRVFVEERGWVSGSLDHDGLERDEFDPFCAAFLVREASTGVPAACQRLILPEHLPAGVVTNVERLSDVMTVGLANLPRESWAEVSRSTIAQQFRWGSSATTMPALLAVKYASIALAVALERRTLFSISDLRTVRLARRIGVRLERVGAAVEFHGRRAPFRMAVEEVVQSIPRPMQPTLAQLIAAATGALRSVRWS